MVGPQSLAVADFDGNGEIGRWVKDERRRDLPGRDRSGRTGGERGTTTESCAPWRIRMAARSHARATESQSIAVAITQPTSPSAVRTRAHEVSLDAVVSSRRSRWVAAGRVVTTGAEVDGCSRRRTPGTSVTAARTADSLTVLGGWSPPEDGGPDPSPARSGAADGSDPVVCRNGTSDPLAASRRRAVSANSSVTPAKAPAVCRLLRPSNQCHAASSSLRS